MGYGTGAIMAVPCGDQRDFEFARQFDLPIPAIQQPPDEWFATRHRATLDTSTWPTRSSATRRTSTRRTARSTSNGLDTSPTPSALIIAVAGGERRTARRPSPTSCATGCSAASATGASRSRSSTTIDGNPHALPDDDAAGRAARDRHFAPRTFDPDDEFSNPESPLDRLD